MKVHHANQAAAGHRKLRTPHGLARPQDIDLFRAGTTRAGAWQCYHRIGRASGGRARPDPRRRACWLENCVSECRQPAPCANAKPPAVDQTNPITPERRRRTRPARWICQTPHPPPGARRPQICGGVVRQHIHLAARQFAERWSTSRPVPSRKNMSSTSIPAPGAGCQGLLNAITVPPRRAPASSCSAGTSVSRMVVLSSTRRLWGSAWAGFGRRFTIPRTPLGSWQGGGATKPRTLTGEARILHQIRLKCLTTSANNYLFNSNLGLQRRVFRHQCRHPIDEGTRNGADAWRCGA